MSGILLPVADMKYNEKAFDTAIEIAQNLDWDSSYSSALCLLEKSSVPFHSMVQHPSWTNWVSVSLPAT